MSSINDYLNEIASASYGSDVRDSIVASIRECYKDATGHPDSVAALVQEYIDREENIDDKVSLLTGLYNSLGEIVYSYDYTNHVRQIEIDLNEIKCVDQITLTPGKWIIKAASYFDNLRQTYGRGVLWLSLFNELGPNNYPTCMERREDEFSNFNSSTIAGTDISMVRMISLIEETTIYLWISHEGGEARVTPYMTAMKIGESTPSDGTSLVDQVVENTEDISILDGKVATNISSISTLESNVDALEEDVADLKADLAQYEDIFTGDVDESVRNWLDEHPEATTTVQDGSISEAKLTSSINTKLNKIEGLEITDIILDSINYNALNDLTGETSDYWLQGGVYVPEKNTYIIAFTDSNFHNVIFVNTSDFVTPSDEFTLPVGHANSITYNPNTDRIYVACRDTGDYPNKVVEIDYTNHVITAQYDFIGPWAIAYDRDNNIYYIGDGGYIRKCDSSFNIIQTAQFTPSAEYVKDGLTHGAQDFDVYNGNVYYLSSILENNIYQGFGIYKVNSSLNVEYVRTFRTTFRGEEVEFITLNGNKFEIISGQSFIAKKHFYVENSIAKTNSNMFDAPIPIPSGTDIDTLKKPGFYNVPGDVQASTLVNCPTTVSFNLYVLPFRSYDLIQILILRTGTIYSRHYESSQNKWSNAITDWSMYRHAYNKGDSITIPEQAFGMIANGKKRITCTIPLSRPVKASSTVSIVNGTMTVRTIAGTILSGASLSNYTVSLSKNDSGIRVQIDSSTEITAEDINNTPVMIGFGGTLKFE